MSRDSAAVTQAMLMAAGLGTRLRPFTDLEPKALLPLMGVPMAQYALDSLAAAGVRRVVANVHHHAERARAGLAALERGGAELIISDESPLLLGSAGGLKKAAPHFGSEPFFLVNADTLSDVDLGALGRMHARLRRQHGVLLTLTVFPAGPRGGKYREILFDRGQGLITGLGQVVENRPYFIGAAVIEPEALVGVPEGVPAEFVPLVLEPAIRARRAGVYLTQGMWHDVGSPGLWLSAHLELLRALETGRVPPRIRNRIESINRRVAHQVWLHNSVPTSVLNSSWAGPAYRAGQGGPHLLGPEAVLYGPVPESVSALERGIGFGGAWVGR